MIAGGKGELELEAPMMEVVQTHIIPERDRIDEDVLRGMTSLGCFKDKDKLVEELLKPCHNTGKFPIHFQHNTYNIGVKKKICYILLF